MDSTKSESNGLRARYGVPPLLVTTTPSGPPSNVSCDSEPRWVWNSLPGVSVMVCIRPLGSVSCTRSPSWSGPLRCAAPVGVSVVGVSVLTGPSFRRSSSGHRTALGCRAPGAGRIEFGCDVNGGEDAEHPRRLAVDRSLHHDVLRGRCG